MTQISDERRLEIARAYWKLRELHGEAVVLEQLGLEYSIDPQQVFEIVAEFPDEAPK